MDAKKALPKDGKGRSTKIHQALSWIGQLYQLERELQDVSAETRQQRRVAQAVPILEKFKAWLDKQSVPPKMLLGKAIGYALQQWPRLDVYVQDGHLSIDNNPVENAIRPFALGRKAWLFSDSQDGARASAALYSLIETAKANGLNDYAYLKYVFTELPTAGDDDAIDALLPWLVDRDAVDAQLNRPN